MDSTPNKGKQKKRDYWPIKVFIMTFMLSLIFNFISRTSLQGASFPVALLVLFLIILVGILFDMIGIAVTCESVTAYTSMASKKIPGARQAIKLVQAAGVVSNICNDVVGDICGIVSGAMGAMVSAELLMNNQSLNEFILTIVVSSTIAALTVGGKALGKKLGMKKSHAIVFTAGKILSVFSKDEKKEGKEKKGRKK